MARFAFLVLLVFVLSTASAAARGSSDGRGDGGRDVRVAGDCGRGASASLRVRALDEGIEVRFRLEQTRGRGVWRLTVVHENRVSSRVTRKTTRADDTFELRRTVPDFTGSDSIVVRAWGPSGLGCRASATLQESP